MRYFFIFVLSLLSMSVSFLEVGCTKEKKDHIKSQEVINKEKLSTDHTFMVKASSYVGNDDGDARDTATTARCNAVKSIIIPHEELPPELKNCDPWDYFYGINNHVIDYEKARKCALNTPNDQNATLNSYQILEMIYANGYGAKQDLDLATKFACDNGEPNQLILDLNLKKYSRNQAFDVCDYADDPNVITICSNFIPMKVNENKRNIQINQIISKWPIADQKAFKHLVEAKDDYIDAYVNGELDVSVYADRRQSDMTDELDGIFFDHFMDTVNGQFPKYSDLQFSEFDRELNQIYHKVMIGKEPYDGSGVTHESVKKVQRSWLKYREAWVAFVFVHYPQISPNNFRAWLTKDRIEDLKEVLEMENDNDDTNT